MLTAVGTPVDGPRVEVRLVDATDASALIQLRAARDGTFTLLRLAPGEYRVSASQDGVSALVEMELAPGAVGDVTLRLTASPNPVALASRGLAFEREKLASLPERALEWESLAELDSQANDVTIAGPTGNGPAGDESEERDTATPTSAGGLSYGGLSPSQNAEVLDGLSAQQSFRLGPRGSASEGPSTQASFGQGAIRSFRVLPRTFSSAYGTAAGGVVAVTSREGSKRLHGSAFLVWQQSAWAATNPFSVDTHFNGGASTSELVKPNSVAQLWGASIGFPLGPANAARWRKAATLFASLDARLTQDNLISSPAVANFYALSATQTALLGTRGVSAAAVRSALTYLDSLSGTVSRHAYRLQPFVRFDAAATANDHVTLGYVGSRFDAPAGAAAGQASDAVVARGTGSLGDRRINVDVATARWLHAFSAHADNEIRAQWAHDLEFETPHAPLPQEPAIGPGGYAPQVSIAPDGFAFGTPSSLGRIAYPDEQRVELADALEMRYGQHLLRIGGAWSRVHDRLDSLTNAEGAFSYDSALTGGHAGGLVDWITDFTFNVNANPNGGCPSIHAVTHDFCFHSFTQSFGPTQTEFTTQEFAGYAEDSWRPRTDLVMTVGARYEYVLLPLPQKPNLVLDAAIAGLGGRVGGATASFPEDRNNVGPRLALAWSPAHHGKPIVTANLGYGAFYGRVAGAEIAAALSDTALPSTTERIRITPTTVTNCPQVTSGNGGFGYPCDFLAAPPGIVTQTTSAKLFAKSFRIPALQRATLELERDVVRGVLLRVRYEMATATQLPTTVDLNIAPSPGLRSFVLQGGAAQPGLQPGETFVVPLYDARVVSQYGPVAAMVSNANATYHAATLEAEFHTARGLELRGSYTFSRAIDYAPQAGAVPGVDGQFDPFLDGYDKGLSSLQFPQRFAGYLLWTAKLGHGAEWLRRSINGIRMAAIATAGSGAPYSYAVYGGSYLSGGRDTMNGSGGATYLPTVGRNTLRLGSRSNLNVRLGREFGVRGHLRLNAFAEAFNLANVRNATRVETRAFLVGTPASPGQPTPLVFQDAATVASEGLTTPAFGTPLSSTGGLSRERRVQVGLRLTF